MYDTFFMCRSHDKELTEPHMASDKPRLFTCCARTEAGVKALLAEAKKNAKSVEFQALIQDSANLSPGQMPYRGFTVLNGANDLEEIQVHCSLFKNASVIFKYIFFNTLSYLQMF